MEEFMLQKYSKQEAYFKRAILADGKNHWPRDPDPEETRYKEWLADVREPSIIDENGKEIVGDFYKGTEVIPFFDEKGTDIPSKAKKIVVEPDFKVKNIIRIRLGTGEEFLYSLGTIYAFNQYGDPRSRPFVAPERHIRTNFHWNTREDPKDHKNKRMCDGPAGTTNVYELPFNEENAKKLWAKKDPTGCNLVLEDEMSSSKKQCPNFEMFITKSFDYIFNMDYMSAEEKAAAREKFEKDLEEQVRGSKKK